MKYIKTSLNFQVFIVRTPAFKKKLNIRSCFNVNPKLAHISDVFGWLKDENDKFTLKLIFISTG